MAWQEGNGPGAKTPDIPSAGGSMDNVQGGSSDNSGGSVPAQSGASGGVQSGASGVYGGQKVTYSPEANDIINRMQNNSLGWHTATEDERKAKNEENKNLAASLAEHGINVEYNSAAGTYTYADGTNLYDTKYMQKLTPYPQYNSKADEIKRAYETALMNQIVSNNEATIMQKLIMEQNMKKSQRELEALRRQSEIDTQNALENEKLRQELRGSKGGIGERIFGTYESAGQQRLLELNLEEERLKADTQMQIAQLEAEGRFKEAELVSQFALEKMNALNAEAERVYNAEVAAANFNAKKEQMELDNIYRDKTFDLDVKRFEGNEKIPPSDENGGEGEGEIPPSDENGVLKSNEVIAAEVIAGKWGNGQERIDRLTAAGYDAAAVQGIVDGKLKKVEITEEEFLRNSDLVKIYGNYQNYLDGVKLPPSTQSTRADNVIRYAMTEKEFLESDIKDRFNGDYEDYIDSLCGVLTDEEKQYAHSGIIAKNGW